MYISTEVFAMQRIFASILLFLALAASADLPASLADLKSYKLGDDRASLRAIEAMVAAASKDAAARKAAADALVAVLPGCTPDARHFALQQLRLIATAEHVQALLPFLKDPATNMDVRVILEVMPGDEASKAMRELLKDPDTDGPVLLGIVASLGVRRDVASVPLLAPLLKSTLPEVRKQAAWSLGQIATPGAAGVLLGVDLDRNVAEALVAAAPTVDQNVELHRIVNSRLIEPDNAEDMKVIGHTGLLFRHGRGEAYVLTLEDADRLRQVAAIWALRTLKDPALFTASVKFYPEVAPEFKPQLLALLADHAVVAARPVFIAAAVGDDRLLRRIGVQGLAKVGGDGALEPLLQAAENMPPGELDLLSAALSQIKGDAVNDRLIAALPAAGPQPAIVITRALVERSASKAVPELLKLATAKDARLAGEAIGGVGELAGPDTVAELLPLLSTPHEPAARSAIASICRRNGRDIAPIAKAYETADAKLKQSLLKALPAIGSKDALTLLRRELAGADAAVKTEAIRSLSVWTDGEPAEDLLQIARKSTSNTDKTLALRGLAKLIPQSQLPRAKQVEILNAALGLAADAQTKGMLQATLKDVQSPAGTPGEVGPAGAAGALKIVEAPTSVALVA
ncbi:MAG: HEAT repeat domain-containing protein, partial [Tepidisphaeraceae bacterium]